LSQISKTTLFHSSEKPKILIVEIRGVSYYHWFCSTACLAT